MLIWWYCLMIGTGSRPRIWFFFKETMITFTFASASAPDRIRWITTRVAARSVRVIIRVLIIDSGIIINAVIIIIIGLLLLELLF
jgi:hypothetical protein